MMIQGEKADLITLERMCLANDPVVAWLDNDVILKLIAVAKAADWLFDDLEFIAAYKVTGNIEKTRAYKELRKALEDLQK